MKSVAERSLGVIFSRFDSMLERDGPYILGERFSAADIYFTMLCQWTRQMAKPALGYPQAKRLVDLVSKRPAWAAMMLADVAVLSADLEKTDPASLKGITPRMTVCDGRVVFEG